MATYNGNQQDSSGNVLLPISSSMATYIETGSTASRAYTKGTYFFYRNRLVKAKSAISSGATLTIGSNVEYVNIADEVSAHLRASDTNKTEFYFDYKDGHYGFYPNASKTASEFEVFGGAFEETVLWTNPSPNAPLSAINIDIGTTALYGDYDYIKFTYKLNTNYDWVYSIICSAEDLLKTAEWFAKGSSGSIQYSNVGSPILITGKEDTPPYNTIHSRYIAAYGEDIWPTTEHPASAIYISNIENGGTLSTPSQYAVPLQVSGLK